MKNSQLADEIAEALWYSKDSGERDIIFSYLSWI